MARISLRAYNREIENLIERGQIEEAISHCKNILKQFPKHIETYRLLGKAYLESQRYAEAADILQRVLSVFPDDFVSQLGMSIIREDEGNLDAAIWHMERAYEIQPFNRAVQDELRRLYGRRDGVEPPRIRLTRGALVRMYARGDLYPQAIAEIRAALLEDANRIDLQVLLARMYYLSGQKIEATEICSSLIGKLPYCYEANKIFMDVLPETSRAEDARIFQQRLFALDPYAAFVSPNAPTSAQVPEQTVMIEKVEWQPSMEDTQGPDWARTIGVQWEEAPQEALPDWLNTIAPSQPIEEITLGEDLEPTAPAEGLVEEAIPDFMREAGWTKSDGLVEEQPSAFQNEEEEAVAEEELIEADIPDWLRSLAPTEQVESAAETTGTEQEQASLDWLEGLLPGSESVEAADAATLIAGPERMETEPVVEEALELHAEEVSGLQEEEPQAFAPEQTPDQQIPDWLQQLSDEPGEAAAEKLAEPAEPVSEDITALLTEESEGTPETLEVASISFDQEVAPEKIEELSPEPVESGEMDVDAGMAWLEALAARQGADEETLKISSPEERDETPPEWIREQLAEQTIETGETEIHADHPVDEATPAFAELAEPPIEQIEPTSQGEEVPLDWVGEEDIQAPQAGLEQPAESLEESPVTGTERTQDLDELLALGKEAFQEEHLASEPTQLSEVTDIVAELSETEETTSAVSPDDTDQALAWLEALAARQGADEETLTISSPDERSETPPEWIQELTEEGATETSPAESVLPNEELLPDLALGGEEEVSQPFGGLDVPEPSSPIEDTQPVGLKPIEQELPPEAIRDELVTEQSRVTQELATDVSSLEAEDAFSWLEKLAEKQGAEPETLITQPEERVETPPDWVSESVEEASLATGDLLELEEEISPETFLPLGEAEVSESLAETGLPMGELEMPLAEEPTQPPATPEEVAIFTEPTQPQVEEPVQEVAEQESIPEWLRSYEEEQAKAEPVWQPDETFQPEAITDEELPTWLREEKEDIPATTEQATTLEPVQESVSDMPDWLKELQEPPVIAEETNIEVETTMTDEARPTSVTPELVTSPPLPPAYVEPGTGPYAQAQSALLKGEIEQAVDLYGQLIHVGARLDDIIADLRNALDRHPVEASLWQTLGDAYIRSNQVQAALDAYTKAEELLR